jgi:hypothetical protein
MHVEFLIFLMSVLTLTDGLCRVWFIYPILCWCWCPEIGACSIHWAQLSRLLPKDRDRIQSLKCCVLNKKQVNVQKLNNCINKYVFFFRLLEQSSTHLDHPSSCHFSPLKPLGRNTIKLMRRISNSSFRSFLLSDIQ